MKAEEVFKNIIFRSVKNKPLLIYCEQVYMNEVDFVN